MSRELNKAGVEVGIGVATVATVCVLGPAAAVPVLAAAGVTIWKAVSKGDKPASGDQSKK